MKSFEPSNKLSTQLKRLHFEAMKDDPELGYRLMDWAEEALRLEQRAEELEDHELEFKQALEHRDDDRYEINDLEEKIQGLTDEIRELKDRDEEG